MKRFLPVAVIVALAGAAVAVVVISSGDGEGPKQPSVEQRISLPDKFSPSLRVPLRRWLTRIGVEPSTYLDRVHSVECGAGRQAPVDIRSSLAPSGTTATCVIRLPGPAEIVAFNVEGQWRFVRAIVPPRIRHAQQAGN